MPRIPATRSGALSPVGTALAAALCLAASCASMDRLSLKSRDSGAPAAGDPPIRVAHVSDLHIRTAAPVYERLSRLVREFAPDLVIITGDILSRPEDAPTAHAVLSGLGDGIPKLAVRGNHDFCLGTGRAAMDAFLAPHGCRLLVNEYADVELRGRVLRFYGADDLLRGEFVPPRAQDLGEGAAFILCHEPAFVSRLEEAVRSRPGTYAFSGHTHGGQITFFGIPLVLPEESGGFVAGEYRVGEMRLFVSRGVGTSRIDLRFFSRPDIILHRF